MNAPDIAALLKGEEVEVAAPSAPTLIEELVRREKARDSLIAFAQFIDPAYVPFKIHYRIADALERVESGNSRRLLIFVPPATGKSRLSSELFPAWFFGRNPNLEFIETSYDHALARSFGREVRNLIKNPSFQLVFPETHLSSDATAMDEWKTSAGGEYKAEGVGGGLIGFHAHVAIMDDPVKGYAEAFSENGRASLWDWYAGTLLNRLRSYKDGPGAVILIMQRWHDDDIGGRLEKLSEEGEEDWEIIRLPSIAEEHDELGREPGEALLPEGPNQRTIEELNAIRARNPRMFQAVHQQKPIADEGDYFQAGWLQLYTEAELPKNLTTYASTDLALSKDSGDYSVILIFGVCSEGHVWLLDLWRKQEDILTVTNKLMEMLAEWKVQRFYMEKVSVSKAYSPIITKERRARGIWAVQEDVSLYGLGGKASPERAGAASGAMQLGYFHAPFNAPWLGDFQYELARFPNGRFDDQVDTIALIGMKLDSLRGRAPESVAITGPPVIKPTAFTFGELVHRNALKRRGRQLQKRAIVVPFEAPSVLDEAAA